MMTITGAKVRRAVPAYGAPGGYVGSNREQGVTRECECFSANSQLINFSCNSSKRIKVS